MDHANRGAPSLDRRKPGGRADADRAVAAWAAEELGLRGMEARAYVDGIVAAGVRSADGRGGFDMILAHLDGRADAADELRHRYFMAMSEIYMGCGIVSASILRPNAP